MKMTGLGACILALTLIPALSLGDSALEFHEDYYLGFSQGAYYGLMLAGEDYHVAWCMKSELAHAAGTLGTGGEFQENLDKTLQGCRSAAVQE